MLIGIIGPKGSGKSTLANIIQQKYNFELMSFASVVKDISSIIFGYDRELLEGETKESRIWRETIDKDWSKLLNKDITPRITLQIIGTEFGRKILGQNIWIEVLKNKISKNKNKNIIISDIRYENEAQFIRDNKGILIRVSKSNLEFNLSETHSSEMELYNIKEDHSIENNGTIEQLEQQIINLFNNNISIYI